MRHLLGRLAADYPACWTFAVDHLVGATPELLVRREKGLAACRVLAGTIRRTGDDADDLRRAAELARSSKDLEEHELAVASLVKALRPYCASINVPEAPFVLHLPNVMHLASDVTGVVDGALGHPSTFPTHGAGGTGPSSLALAAALHPTAAVGGTPTREATAILAEAERMDRARYAGPVGWIGADGDGEWGIALRSGELERDRPARGAALRRLRRGGRLGPGRRAGRVRGEAPADARGAGRALRSDLLVLLGHQGGGDLEGLAAADHREGHLVAAGVLAHEPGQRQGAVDGVAVDGDDDVARLQPGVGGRGARLHGLDLRAGPGGAVGGGDAVLHRHAEERVLGDARP